MSIKAFSIKRFLVISLIFNLPPILAITKIGLLFLPLLFWANIPVLWTGVAKAMGETHFKIEEFGALPQSVTAYAVVVLFWLCWLVSFLNILANNFLPIIRALCELIKQWSVYEKFINPNCFRTYECIHK